MFNKDKKLSPMLSDDQLNKVVTVIISAFDLEVSRIIDKVKLHKVFDFMNQYYYNRDLYSFFVLLNLKSVTEDIFTNELLRDFMLNLTERVSLLLATDEFDDCENLINSYIIAITRNKPGSKRSSLINAEVNDSIYADPATLKLLLTDNFWLAVLYILIMFFQQTQLWQSSQQTQVK